MAILFPAIGAAVAVAGGDKLAGDRAYIGLFRRLGWSRNALATAGVAEVVGGLLMARRGSRRLGGALVAAASAAVLVSELRHRDGKLAAPRSLMMLAGVMAMLAPGRR